jgi:hypothetical protein
MDHTEAVRLHAAEKYLLNELTQAQRDAYEEHYFDCADCAEELKTTMAFMQGAREVLRRRAPETVESKKLARVKGGWFGWLRPAYAIPVFAALLLLVVYQNGVTIPKLKQASSRALTAETFKSFSLLSVGTRGEGSAALAVKVRPDELFAFEVDMPGNSDLGYLCQIQDQSGRVRLTLPVSAEQAKSTVHVKIPAGALEPGSYRFLIFKGQTSVPSNSASAVSQLPFTVEFVQ